MNPSQRSELESQAERALRRGEVSVALGLLGALAQAFPDEGALQRRLEDLKASALPEELRAAPRRAPSPVPEAPASHADETHEAEGERLFQRGDFLGAAAAYRRALRDKPHSELLQERLVELIQLAQATPRAPRAPAPSAADRGPSSPPGDVQSGTADAEHGGAVGGGPAALLEALLPRIAARRRSTSGVARGGADL